MLLIKFMRSKAAIAWTLSNLVAFLRWNLFTYRVFLANGSKKPEDTPPIETPPSQQPLPFLGFGQHILPKTTTSTTQNNNLAVKNLKTGFSLILTF